MMLVWETGGNAMGGARQGKFRSKLVVTGGNRDLFVGLGHCGKHECCPECGNSMGGAWLVPIRVGGSIKGC